MEQFSLKDHGSGTGGVPWSAYLRSDGTFFRADDGEVTGLRLGDLPQAQTKGRNAGFERLSRNDRALDDQGMKSPVF
ncbi:MAG: hypothetical protein Ct9H300mP1_01090 [Planctomycetaceae bacterium]|nr:MAG: hypothetical protein Ct9H300mP1_01090 [Planctomycetaceae bacterium]